MKKLRIGIFLMFLILLSSSVVFAADGNSDNISQISSLNESYSMNYSITNNLDDSNQNSNVITDSNLNHNSLYYNGDIISTYSNSNEDVNDSISVYAATDLPGGNFGDLNQTINPEDSNAVNISLSGDIKLDSTEQSAFVNGTIINKTVTIDGAGHTIDASSLSGDHVRVFNVSSTGNLTLKNLIITGGLADYGGAISVSNGLLTLINCTFINNNASKSFGGAIYLNSIFKANLTFDNCTFINNYALYSGGAIYGGIVNFTVGNNSHFINNSVRGLNTGSGGAIYTIGVVAYGLDFLTIGDNVEFINNTANGSGGAIYANFLNIGENATFINNSALNYNGGAIYAYSNITIGDNPKFINNSAYIEGGAIHISSYGGAEYVIMIGKNAIFLNNRAITNYGGAISAVYSFIFIDDNANFTNNWAYNYGGAIFAQRNVSIKDNSNFVNNSANYGGAIYTQFDNISTGKNTSFINNSALSWGGAIFANDYGAYVTIGNDSNIINNTAGSSGGAIRTNGNVIIGEGSNILFNTINNSYGGAIRGSIVKINYCIIVGNAANASSFSSAIYTADITNSDLENNWWGHNTTTYTSSPYELNYTNNNITTQWLILNLTNDSAIHIGVNSLTINLTQGYNNTTSNFIGIDGSRLPEIIPVIMSTSNTANAAENIILLNGVGKTNYTVNSPGDDNVTATIYVNSTTIIFSNKVITSLTGDNVSAHPGDVVNISVNVTDVAGNPVANGSVNTTVGGVDYTAVVVNGSATFVDVVMPNTGLYNITVDYRGNDYYENCTNNISLNITKWNTVLSGSNVSGKPGENKTVNLSLVDEFGNPIDTSVTVVLANGSNITVTIVNGTGSFNITLESSVNYTVVYNGSDRFNSSNGTGFIVIELVNTSVTGDNVSAHLGDVVNISVNVADEFGNPVVNGSVNTTVGGVDYTAVVVNGSATFVDVVMPNEGLYNITVDYMGNDYYNSSVAILV